MAFYLNDYTIIKLRSLDSRENKTWEKDKRWCQSGGGVNIPNPIKLEWKLFKSEITVWSKDSMFKTVDRSIKAKRGPIQCKAIIDNQVVVAS